MAIKVLELLAQYGGITAIVLGVPYITLVAAIVLLWRNSIKDKERILKLVEDKVSQDIKMEAAFISLKEVIRAQRG